MLRHTDFDMKGGMQTFAAVFIEVHFADKATLGLPEANGRFRCPALAVKEHG